MEDLKSLEGRTQNKTDTWYYSYIPNNVSGGSTQPLIPLFIAEGLGGNIAQVGVITAASSVASVPSSIFWGNLSDKLKIRKIFVILGFLGMGISFILMGLCGTIEQYFIANIIFGILATASGPIAIVLIMETSEEKHWGAKIGRFSKIGGWGWVAGLVIGSTWLSIPQNAHNEFALRMLFVISASLSFVSALMAYIWIDEPKVKLNRMKAENLIKVHLRHQEKSQFFYTKLLHIPGKGTIKKLRHHGLNISHSLVHYFGVTMIFTVAFTCFYTVFPIFLLQKLGIATAEVFVIYMSSSIASALLYEKAGHFVENYGAKKILSFALVGRIIIIPSFLLLLAVYTQHYIAIIVLIILQALMGFCWAMVAVSGTTLAGELSPIEAKGESLGMYTAIQGIASIIGALIGGVIAFVYGYQTAILIPTILVIVAFIVLLRVKLISHEVDKGKGQGCSSNV